MSSWFTIARVLPGHLGLNGSAANAEIVATTLSALGHSVSIIDINAPADVVSTVDLVCVGSGSGSALKPAATELLGLVRALTLWQSHGAWFFAVGTGWDLLGRNTHLADGTEMPGAGIFPSVADHRTQRFSGEVAGLDYRGRPSAGYVNTIGTSVVDDAVEALCTISASAGEYPSREGLVGTRMMATKIGGPALALNPHWVGDIVGGLLEARGLDYTPGEFQHRIEHAATAARAKINARVGFTP